jgi:hypothetical protein
MDDQALETAWERITSGGRLVYWRRRLGDGGWLAVSRDGTASQPWEWAHRGPEYEPRRRLYRTHAHGRAGTSAAAKRAADAAAGASEGAP